MKISRSTILIMVTLIVISSLAIAVSTKFDTTIFKGVDTFPSSKPWPLKIDYVYGKFGRCSYGSIGLKSIIIVTRPGMEREPINLSNVDMEIYINQTYTIHSKLKSSAIFDKDTPINDVLHALSCDGSENYGVRYVREEIADNLLFFGECAEIFYPFEDFGCVSHCVKLGSEVKIDIVINGIVTETIILKIPNNAKRGETLKLYPPREGLI